ncbi:hypothetical protein SprV_0301284300 [Sparganum proliferum]
MRMREGGIDRSLVTPSKFSTPTMPSPTHTPPPSAPTVISSTTFSTSCTPTMLSPTHTPSPSAPTTTSPTISITEADTHTADFSCPPCLRIFTSRIGLVGHLRVHRTKTGEPMSEAPTYIHRIRLHCPHCTHTFMHRMGHMRVHGNLQ